MKLKDTYVHSALDNIAWKLRSRPEKGGGQEGRTRIDRGRKLAVWTRDHARSCGHGQMGLVGENGQMGQMGKMEKLQCIALTMHRVLVIKLWDLCMLDLLMF